MPKFTTTYTANAIDQFSIEHDDSVTLDDVISQAVENLADSATLNGFVVREQDDWAAGFSEDWDSVYMPVRATRLG